MGDDFCIYTNKETRMKCGHTLGPWTPDNAELPGVTEVMTRTCEKCGGKQTQFRCAELDQVADDIFDSLKGDQNG